MFFYLKKILYKLFSLYERFLFSTKIREQKSESQQLHPLIGRATFFGAILSYRDRWQRAIRNGSASRRALLSAPAARLLEN